MFLLSLPIRLTVMQKMFRCFLINFQKILTPCSKLRLYTCFYFHRYNSQKAVESLLYGRPQQTKHVAFMVIDVIENVGILSLLSFCNSVGMLLQFNHLKNIISHVFPWKAELRLLHIPPLSLTVTFYTCFVVSTSSFHVQQ